MKDSSKLRGSVKKWEDEAVAATVKRFPEREEKFETISGLPVDRLYAPLDLENLDYE